MGVVGEMGAGVGGKELPLMAISHNSKKPQVQITELRDRIHHKSVIHLYCRVAKTQVMCKKQNDDTKDRPRHRGFS